VPVLDYNFYNSLSQIFDVVGQLVKVTAYIFLVLLLILKYDIHICGY